MTQREGNASSDIVKYVDGQLEIDVIIDGEGQTVWASRAQMAVLFGVKRENISYHVKNVLAEADGDLNGSCKEILHDPNDERIIRVPITPLDAEPEQT